MLVSSGSRMFPSLSRTTRSRSKYLAHKNEIISEKKELEMKKVVQQCDREKEKEVFRPLAERPISSECNIHSAVLFPFNAPANTQSMYFITSPGPVASAEVKAISPPGQRFKVSSQEQNGASQFSLFNRFPGRLQTQHELSFRDGTQCSFPKPNPSSLSSG